MGVTGSSTCYPSPGGSGAHFHPKGQRGSPSSRCAWAPGAQWGGALQGNLEESWAKAAPHSVAGLLVDRAQGAGGLK